MQLTHAAAQQVTSAREAQGVPDSFGLRVYGEPQPSGATALGLAFAPVPAEDDEVSEQQGLRVFVAPEVAGPLASAALDVEETPEGAKLVLTQQDEGEI
jgi:Fe-S cluster assembly iron-binding protein IscA